MVHVEIFLGGETGEATIGARFQKGFVQIFPSYKFDSKLWSLKQFHFCSLDTWLDGICRSHCSEHPWIIPTISFTGGKSIFDEEEGDESAGEDLGDEEDPDPVQGQGQGEGGQGEGEEGQEEEEEDADMIGGGDGDDSDDNKEETIVPIQAKKPPLKKASSRTSAGTVSLPPFFVFFLSFHLTAEGKPKRVSAAATTAAGAATPTPLTQHASQSNNSVSRVNRSRSMDSPPKPKKASSDPTGETTAAPLGSSKISSSSSRSPAPLTYYVGEGNGWRFIKTALDKRGWQQLPFEYSFSTRFTMKWVERRSQIDFSSYHDGQVPPPLLSLSHVLSLSLSLLTSVSLSSLAAGESHSKQ
jgi:hypothetical protein